MATIWILSYGDYSDYSVTGVMPDQETAERVAEELGGSYQAEELEVLEDTTVVEYYRLRFGCDGNGENQSEYEHSYKTLRFQHQPVTSNYHFFEGRGTPGTRRHQPAYGQLLVEGYDIERMRKVYSEMKARIIADEVYRRMSNS